MARALTSGLGLLYAKPIAYRLRRRPPLIYQHKASQAACKTYKVIHRERKLEQIALLQGKATRKPQLQQRCHAGLTASYEGTRTQSSEPSGASVTEQMFDRAARHASAAGPGIRDWHRLFTLAKVSTLFHVTPAIDPYTANIVCSWGCWWYHILCCFARCRCCLGKSKGTEGTTTSC